MSLQNSIYEDINGLGRLLVIKIIMKYNVNFSTNQKFLKYF